MNPLPLQVVHFDLNNPVHCWPLRFLHCRQHGWVLAVGTEDRARSASTRPRTILLKFLKVRGF